MPHNHTSDASHTSDQQHVQRGLRQFSWFILRIANPGMRALFMNPGNELRTQKAVLAGDVDGRSPTQPPLPAFKAVDDISAALQWRAPWADYKAWRRNRADVGMRAGKTVMQPAQRS